MDASQHWAQPAQHQYQQQPHHHQQTIQHLPTNLPLYSDITSQSATMIDPALYLDPQLHNTDTISLEPVHVTGVRFIASFEPTKRKIALKSSINPVDSATYIRECDAAAAASRLPPSNMSPAEMYVFREHISHLQITTYLITRNAILRLWQKNPLLYVSIDEAQGVAREERHFPLCRAIWEFLMRHGYINFGCLEIPDAVSIQAEEKQIVVVGAGIAGLCAARQLQTLIAAFQHRLKHNYTITVLEGRGRIGGRVYSHPLKAQHQGTVCRVDLGAQIVTGFSGGNPLTVLLQRQLSLPYHSLVHAKNNKIHGRDGLAIDPIQDTRVEGLFNLLLDAAARYRLVKTEDVDQIQDESQSTNHAAVADKVLGVGKAEAVLTLAADPLEELRRLGYAVKDNAELRVVPAARSLGETMRIIFEAYTEVSDISQADTEILSWHWANMEYACGTALENLSLLHWDQDDGNEFRGHHAMVVGGYNQLARGLALAPTKLNIITNTDIRVVRAGGVVTSTGVSIAADKVVVTVPLGVLKSNKMQFEPALPDWKLHAMQCLGYGLLNKVVLVYNEQFWDADIDLIGTTPLSPSEQARGRFYMFWNCTEHASGRPVLVALMAGEAAYSCEQSETTELVKEATELLQRIHPDKKVPEPEESIITKWQQDPFSQGSYSFIGPEGSGADYDLLARPVGDTIFFAGEATCRTHPSTVHGAYLSGLAAAKSVLDSLLGEQVISADRPLVPVKAKAHNGSTSVKSESKKRKFETFTESGEKFRNEKDKYNHLRRLRLTKERDSLQAMIVKRLGIRPEQPKRTNANPFLVFQKDQWHICKSIADQAQQKKSKDPTAKASKNQIRACLGQTWRETSDVGKQPWIEKVTKKREEYEQVKSEWEAQNAKYDQDTKAITQEFDEQVRPTLVTEEEKACLNAIEAKKRPDTAIPTVEQAAAPSAQPDSSNDEDQGDHAEAQNGSNGEPMSDDDDLQSIPVYNDGEEEAKDDAKEQ